MSLTVNPSELHGLLVDLQRTAGGDPTLPMIDGILLHADSKDGSVVLVGTSTNRFMVGQAHIEATGELSPVFVRGLQVKQLVEVLKSYSRTTKLLCEITSDGDKLTAKLPGDMVLPAVTISVKCTDDADFPKIAHVFDKDAAAGEGSVAFDARFLASLGMVAKRRNEYLRVELSHNNMPSRINIGGQYRALLMPVRQHENEATAPTFVPPRERKPVAEDVAA